MPWITTSTGQKIWQAEGAKNPVPKVSQSSAMQPKTNLANIAASKPGQPSNTVMKIGDQNGKALRYSNVPPTNNSPVTPPYGTSAKGLQDFYNENPKAYNEWKAAGGKAELGAPYSSTGYMSETGITPEAALQKQNQDVAKAGQDIGLDIDASQLDAKTQVAKKKAQDLKDAEDLKKKNELEKANELAALKERRQQEEGATAGVLAQTSAGREGIQSTGNAMLGKQVTTEMNARMDRANEIYSYNQQVRDDLEKKLQEAQAAGDEKMAEAYYNQLAQAENNLANADAARAKTIAEANKMASEFSAASMKKLTDMTSISSGLSVAFAGQVAQMDIPTIQATYGLDDTTANILKTASINKIGIDPKDPEYAQKVAAVDRAQNDAIFKNMTAEQKNFEYYKGMLAQDPEGAQKFAKLVGLEEESFFGDFQTEYQGLKGNQEKIFSDTGAVPPINSKYKYEIQPDGSISFELSAPNGTVLQTRGQCGEFVNDCLVGGPGLFGDTFKQKKGKVNSMLPIAGGAFVEDVGNSTGHVGLIERVYNDGSFDIRESNYYSPNKVTVSHIALGSDRHKSILAGGFYAPPGVKGAAAKSGSLDSNPTFQKYAQALADGKMSLSDLKNLGMTKGDLQKLQTAALDKMPAQVEGLDKDQKNNYIQLKNNYRNRPEVSEFKTIQAAYSKIKSASPTAAGDLSMIFSYMKLLDPTSAVREAEFDNAEKAAPLLEKYGLSNKLLKVWEGTRMTDVQRQDFLKQSEKLYSSSKNIFDNVVNEYKNDAMILGLPSDIDYTLGGYDLGETSESSDALGLGLGPLNQSIQMQDALGIFN